MSLEKLRHRLRQGRPLVLDADTGASFRTRGVALDTPGSLGALLRERPGDVLLHYRAEAESRVDVLCALTADTMPRALAEAGMQHRAALLTGLAVDLALEAAAESRRPIAVAGVLGSEMVSPIAAARMGEELEEHGARLAASGCELILARGQGSRLELTLAVAAGATTELPTWAIVECLGNGQLLDGGTLEDLAGSVQAAGAEALLFEVPSGALGRKLLDAAQATLTETGLFAGVLLAASDASVRGFPDPESRLEHWVAQALELAGCGARVIGGGAGTTEAHSQALALALGARHPSIASGHQTMADSEAPRESELSRATDEFDPAQRP